MTAPTPHSGEVVIQTLGACRAGRRPIDGDGATFGRGKPLALLTYLASVARMSASRDELVNLLWADVEPEAGRHALRQTVWYVRKRIGDDTITGNAATVSLARRVEFDRDQFLEAADAGDCVAAVAAYGGEFLPQFAVPGGGEFERWAEVERNRLRAMFVRCAESLVRDSLSSGRYKEAQGLARRVAEADPYHQAGRRLVLDTLVAANDALGAASEADAFEQFLRAEEIDPEPATRSAIAIARAPRPDGKSQQSPQTGLVADLIGREAEFARLLHRWNAARSGESAHVHIVGAAGLGKTRLLNDFHSRLRARRSRAAQARANPGERRVPFALVADFAQTLARLPGAIGLGAGPAAALVALNPALSSVFSVTPEHSSGADAIRHRALAVAELARAVADDAPLAILIDDLHWADDESKQVLAMAFARLDGSSTLVVTTARPDAEVVLSREPTEVVRLEPLSRAAVADMVSSLGSVGDEPWSASLPSALHAATGGSPLLLIETLQFALDSGALVLSDDEWSCPDPAQLAELFREGSAVERRVRALPRAEGWILTLLAVAGVPISDVQVAAIISHGPDDVGASLSALERKGLARRLGGGWHPAHDEIAECVVRTASADAIRKAHIHLGTHFASLPRAELHGRTMAVEHLLRAGQVAAVRALFLEELAVVRRTGDWRPTTDIGREFAGAGAAPGMVDEMCAGIPFRLRRRQRIGRIAAVCTVIALAAVSLAFSLHREPVVDAWLWVGTSGTGPPSYGRVALDGTTFRDDGPLNVRVARGHPAPAIDTLVLSGRAVRMADGSYAYSTTRNDSGGIDIYRATPSGAEERLTNSPGDDDVIGTSPDGRLLLFLTQRWNKLEHSDLAVLDPATRQVTPLTKTDEYEFGGRWSPDGTRIAFGRSFFSLRAPEVCVRTVDGAEQHCVQYPGAFSITPLGWRGATEILATINLDAETRLFRLDTESWQFVELVRGGTAYEVSNDGELFAMQGGSVAGGGWAIGAVSQPGKLRQLAIGGPNARESRVAFAAGSVPPRFLDTLRVIVPGDGIPLDSRQRLAARGVSARGQGQAVHGLAWRSLDTAVARVAVDGTVTPVRTGTFRAVASAGGWRVDTARIEITGRQAAEAFTEKWDRIDPARWVAFGVPRPFIMPGGRGAALDVNGDSTFQSGVYSTRLFTPAKGFAVRASVSVKLTSLQWQTIGVVVAPVDSGALAGWDRVTGDPPTVGQGKRCAATVPFAEGFPGVMNASAAGPGAERVVRLTEGQRKGGWIVVDIQVFPDGRCGVALDGKAVAMSQVGFDVDRPLMVQLSGKSYHTHSRVGAVELWTGVRPGIDWGPALEGAAKTRPAGQ